MQPFVASGVHLIGRDERRGEIGDIVDGGAPGGGIQGDIGPSGMGGSTQVMPQL